MSSERQNEAKGKQGVPAAEGWFTTPTSGEEPRLIGNSCSSCGEVYFPRESLCLRCGSQELGEITLNKSGTLYSFTIIRQQPPVYKGPVPYAVGTIELPEKIRIVSLLTDCDFDALRIGMKMELVIEKLHEDEAGNDVVCYKFKPVQG